MAGVLKSRLPTLAVILMTACFFAALTLVVLPRPQDGEDKHSVRARHEAERALQEAVESAKAAAAAPPGVIPVPPQERQTDDKAALSMLPDNKTGHEENVAGTVKPVAQDDNIALAPAPDSDVAEKVDNYSYLPRIAADGREPWRVYARPFKAGKDHPRIAVIVAGIGGDSIIANAAIERLPGDITLAFEAQSPAIGDLLARARKAGHETLLSIPAEPFDYPYSDPGPGTLLTNLSSRENLRRLLGFLRQGSGYVGLTTFSGDRFLGTPKSLQLLLEEARKRGLALLDARLRGRRDMAEQAARMKLPVVAVDWAIVQDMSGAEMDRVLSQVSAAARQGGQAVCLIMASPLAMDRLNHWLLGLTDSGILLAPMTALLE